ncbi:thiamine-phosphate kinase [Desulfogranum mediterraneum]|uniref:thiamine-phosphate kinase n=1 Tax=Desulfogranum mediterraneum TaxID=160661 RepID=UPI00041648F2|nr:thiamine-phosphate kinase [Desulfogranum mediterraneum]
MNERAIIDHISGLVGGEAEQLVLGIGDDCAVIGKDDQEHWLLTMDTLVESVHFDRSWHPAHQLGRKTISVNVSDVAAMGGRPQFMLLSVGLPPGFDREWFAAFSQGIAEACRDYGCLLVGGDTVRSPESYNFTVTAIGTALRDQVIYRHGARPGDTIWVSDYLGQAAAGLELFHRGVDPMDGAYGPLCSRHLDPLARTVLGSRLGSSGLVHAMMDLSDGLATDLAHLCKRSQVQGRIDADRLPLSPQLLQAAALLSLPPEQLALKGGEDYELLFTAPPEARSAILEIGRGCGLQLHEVGRIGRGCGVILRTPVSGSQVVEEQIDYGGFDHFNSQDSKQ